MSAKIPSYIPAPNWDIPADSSVVVLGRMIKDPKNPESQIPKSNVVSIAPSDIQLGDKEDWHTTSTQFRSGKIGVWAKCLQIVGLGGDLSFSKLKSSLEDHKFGRLETKYFLPDEYLKKALEDPFVQGYLEVNSGRKPVYMITGIKIARGASVSTEKKKDIGVDGKLGVDLTALAATPVSFGPEGKLERNDRRKIEYSKSTDYIFAYRLTRLKLKKGGGFSGKSYVSGAVFGNDGDEGEVDDDGKPISELYDVEDFDGEGVGIPDTLEEIQVDDAHHETE
jgi:hypothetical protein